MATDRGSHAQCWTLFGHKKDGDTQGPASAAGGCRLRSSLCGYCHAKEALCTRWVCRCVCFQEGSGPALATRWQSDTVKECRQPPGALVVRCGFLPTACCGCDVLSPVEWSNDLRSAPHLPLFLPASALVSDCVGVSLKVVEVSNAPVRVAGRQ